MFTQISSANGEAELAVQTVKNLLRMSADPYVALLMYRATPLQNGFAPSELLMGRKLKTKLPSLKKTQTSNSHLPLLFQKEQRYRDTQRDNVNRHHAVQQSPELKPGDSVYIKDLNRSGSIISRHPNPRSYIVDTAGHNSPQPCSSCGDTFFSGLVGPSYQSPRDTFCSSQISPSCRE